MSYEPINCVTQSQGSQLSRIAHETCTFRTKLGLTRIAPFFSRIMRGAVQCTLPSTHRLATRFAYNVSSLVLQKKNTAKA